MTTHIESLLEKAVWLDQSKTYKPNDYLVLSDDTLNAALDKTRPLTQNEWDALIASPLTLRRLRVLIGQRAAAANRGDVERRWAAAANDPLWRDSRAILRAASSGDAAPAITAENGNWRLLFLAEPEGYRLVLKFDLDCPDADRFLGKTVEILVGRKRMLLLRGPVDEFTGELRADWPHEEAPYPYLAARGEVLVLPAED